jgi:hypothetical protein
MNRHPPLFRAVAGGANGEGPEGRRQARRSRLCSTSNRSSTLRIGSFPLSISHWRTARPARPATVKFKNFDKPATVRLNLVNLKNDCRLCDITWLRDGKAGSLRKTYGH